ncbi:MAG: tripartite tricarboxylate transporter TctB family protein [Phycisphaerales bacterium]|nr:MAG: tripartite tricarboxylate transporter TctB family protein [Phycisphaerales bacterium]
MKKATLTDHSAFNGDFLLGLVLLGSSLFVMIESLRMPMRGSSGFLMSPGFAPCLLAGALFCLSAGYTVGAYLKGGARGLRPWLRRAVTDPDSRRLGILVILIGGYVIALAGRIPFSIATLIYHGAIFYYLNVGNFLKIVVYSILATLLVAFVLPMLFEMPLP